MPAQAVIATTELAFDIPVFDVTPDTVAAARRRAGEHRFDLSSELPVRATLLRLGDQQHELVLTVHHIAIDGESLAPLARDLEHAYRARAPAARLRGRILPVQYRDYAAWQGELLGDPADPGSVLATQLRYWCEELRGAPDQLSIAVDHPRPAVPSGRGGMVEFPIPAELVDAVTRLAQDHAATPAMVLQAALAVLLFHLGAGEDVPIGSTHAGRERRGAHRPGRLLRQYLGPARRPIRQPILQHAGRPGSRQGAGRLREPRRSVRPAGQGHQPGALGRVSPAVPGDVHVAERGPARSAVCPA